MLIGDGWAFIHIPKCGGTTVRSYLSGVEVGEIMPLGKDCAIRSPFHRMPEKRPAGKVFTVVRHPADWIRSYWLNCSSQTRFLDQYMSDDLDDFARRLCAGSPGYVSALYSAHIKWKKIKVFRLEDGLDKAIEYAGVHVEHLHTMNKSMDGPQLNKRSRRIIARCEARAIKRFLY